MKQSYWSMLKVNFDSPGEILPLLLFFVSSWFLYLKVIDGTIWLAALGLCLTAHTINHAVDPADVPK